PSKLLFVIRKSSYRKIEGIACAYRGTRGDIVLIRQTDRFVIRNLAIWSRGGPQAFRGESEDRIPSDKKYYVKSGENLKGLPVSRGLLISRMGWVWLGSFPLAD